MIVRARVPCNGCTACCHCPVMLSPALGDDPSKYVTETVKDIGMMLARKSDGSCVYLLEHGCGIWADAPALCRAFDCRIYARSKFAEIDPLRDEAVIKAGLAR